MANDRARNDALRKNAEKRYKAAAVRALRKLAIHVENESKRSMQGPSPSAPGSPPAVSTGHLRRSITHEVNASALNARVGTNVKYARIQEYGGVIRPKNAGWLTFPIGKGKDAKWVKVKRVQLPPRPFLRPALARVMREVYPTLKQEFEKA